MAVTRNLDAQERRLRALRAVRHRNREVAAYPAEHPELTGPMTA